MSSDGVLFDKKDVARSSSAAVNMAEIWDDTELIKMYEESVSATYNKIGVSSGQSDPMGDKKWKVGDRCTAQFQEDELWYPAEITDIDEDQKHVEVLFDVYGNQEWVDVKKIYSEKEYFPGNDTVENETQMDTQTVLAENSEMGESASESGSNPTRSNNQQRRLIPPHNGGEFRSPIPSIAPPPLPSFSELSSPSEMEALSSMLMSWYMSGYHTGYYQAMNDAKKKK